MRLAVLVLVGIGSGWVPGMTRAATDPAVITISAAQRHLAGVETTELSTSDAELAGRLQFAGRIEFEGHGPSVFLSPADGHITAVYKHPGELVATGERLLAISGPAIGIARQELRVAVTANEIALRRLARDRLLLEAGAIPRSRFEASQAADRDARAALETVRARLAGGHFDAAGNLLLHAPCAGRVLGSALAPGDTVTTGQSLGYVASKSTEVHAALAVPVSIARTLRVGDGALVRSTACETSGKVRAIGQDIDPAMQGVAVHVDFDAPSCFLPGEAVSARLSRRAVVAGFPVPATAFVGLGDRTYVFVEVASGFRAVEVDSEAARSGFVRSPALHAGERVVFRGAAILKTAWLKSAGS
ncbi:MAG: efflux RND transporter periplasmic adaptor subunit [Proteobacteria bacterium]|nr:efflux RND transporter periplasmic adaptor subunit [Pseudomonadota bacterium]